MCTLLAKHFSPFFDQSCLFACGIFFSFSQGLDKEIRLGNLNALRDWGHAKDYVEAMWLMLQQEKPEDFVVATGEQHSVREFCEICFNFIGIAIKWKGEGVNEIGYDAKDESRILLRVLLDVHTFQCFVSDDCPGGRPDLLVGAIPRPAMVQMVLQSQSQHQCFFKSSASPRVIPMHPGFGSR